MHVLNNDLDYEGQWDNELLLVATGDQRSNNEPKYPMIPGAAHKKELNATVLSSKKKQIISVPPIYNAKRKVSKFMVTECM